MTRIELMENSNIWQNIMEVAVQTSNFASSGHFSALLRPELRFPYGMYPVLLK